jgi:hypothetical protein
MAAYQNVTIPVPESPGPWVNRYRCVCGAHLADYRKSHYGITYGEANDRLREENQAAELAGTLGSQTTFDLDDPPGGFRSRGAVLWVMHIMKLEAWYAEHQDCDPCQIAEDWPDWWADQEEIARDQGFTGEWDWCDDEPDDDQLDDDDDFDEVPF